MHRARTLENVKDGCPLFFNFVSTPFDHTASFSAMTFKVVPYCDLAEVLLSVKLNQLFAPKDPEEQHFEHLKLINDCQDHHIWPPNPNSFKYKKNVMIEICTEVLKPLCRAEELIFEKSMSVLSTAKTDVTGLKVADIGLGTVKTWHGTPDARVRGSHLVFQKV